MTNEEKEEKKHIYKYIGPMIGIGRESQCLPYAGFFIITDERSVTL